MRKVYAWVFLPQIYIGEKPTTPVEAYEIIGQPGLCVYRLGGEGPMTDLTKFQPGWVRAPMLDTFV